MVISIHELSSHCNYFLHGSGSHVLRHHPNVDSREIVAKPGMQMQRCEQWSSSSGANVAYDARDLQLYTE